MVEPTISQKANTAYRGAKCLKLTYGASNAKPVFRAPCSIMHLGLAPDLGCAAASARSNPPGTVRGGPKRTLDSGSYAAVRPVSAVFRCRRKIWTRPDSHIAGQNRLAHMRLLLTQHRFAVAAGSPLPRSEDRRTRRSPSFLRIELRPHIRRNLVRSARYGTLQPFILGPSLPQQFCAPAAFLSLLSGEFRQICHSRVSCRPAFRQVTISTRPPA